MEEENKSNKCVYSGELSLKERSHCVPTAPKLIGGER